MVRPTRLFIGGEWRPADASAPVTDPWTGKAIRSVGLATDRDIREAVAAARDAFNRTRRLARDERSALLGRIAAGIEAAKEKLADLILREAGKPIAFARAEVTRAVQTFTLASHEALRFGGEVVPIDIAPHARGYRAMTDRFPKGVIGAISPFNFPLNLVAHKVAPALAVGAAVVHKPASATPLTALKLAEIVEAAGATPGAYNVVPCPGRIGERIVRDPRVAFVTFTGSPEVGWRLKEVSGSKGVTLELGGNAGVIVHEDADLGAAAVACVKGGFAYAGQVCISVQRIYVHHRVFDRFVRRLLKETAAMRVGDPRHPDCVMSSVIDDEAAARILVWVREARDAGAEVLTGGRRRRGRLLAPTILTGTRKSMKVSGREVFGPVIVVERYRRFDDAVRKVDDSDYGLQAGIFTRDLNLVHRAFEGIEVGGLIVNQAPTFRVDAYPYGGVKRSGLGREGVRYAMEEMTEPRILVMNLS